MRKNVKPKRPVGRPPVYQFDRQRILDRVIWASRDWLIQDYNCSGDALDNFIQREFNCNYTDLKKKRREEVGGMLLLKSIDLALKGNVTLIIFLLKSLVGMNENQVQEARNMNGLSTFLNNIIQINKPENGTTPEAT
jgi:hypothetical protein